MKTNAPQIFHDFIKNEPLLFLEHFTIIVYYSVSTISVYYFQIDAVNRILVYTNSFMNTDSPTVSTGGSAAQSV
jgi:hypothetical protein